MPKRKILITKSFEKGLKNWEEYKLETEADLKHYTSKIRFITKEVIRIAELPSYPFKKVNYRSSKKIQYFVYQQHVVFFRMNDRTLKLLYFIAAKRVKNRYI